MAFPRKLLNDDEDIVLDLHPHWWYFAGPLAALVAAIAVGLVAVAAEWRDLRHALGLRKVPHYSTLAHAARRLLAGWPSSA